MKVSRRCSPAVIRCRVPPRLDTSSQTCSSCPLSTSRKLLGKGGSHQTVDDLAIEGRPRRGQRPQRTVGPRPSGVAPLRAQRLTLFKVLCRHQSACSLSLSKRRWWTAQGGSFRLPTFPLSPRLAFSIASPPLPSGRQFPFLGSFTATLPSGDPTTPRGQKVCSNLRISETLSAVVCCLGRRTFLQTQDHKRLRPPRAAS